MSQNFGTLVAYGVGVVTGNWWMFAASLYGQQQAHQARKNARSQAQQERDKYNAGLQDRLEMVDVTPDALRTRVYGRVRYVEGVRRKWVSGTNSEKLTMIVSFASHEIDAFEQFYFDDKPVEVDASGWVTTAPYAKGQLSSARYTFTPTATSQTITLPNPPIASSVAAHWSAGSGYDAGSATVGTVSGTSVPLSGLIVGRAVTVTYQRSAGVKTARIRTYLGTATQNVGADLAAEYPGKITAADKFAGIALAVVDVLYDPDVYPQGRPNVTAVLRGAKVVDLRTGTQVWSENPANIAYDYATWSRGYGLDPSELNIPDVIDAANACDISTIFSLRKADGSYTTATLPRFRCGITVSGADPKAEMADILETMAGRQGWAGGLWRMRAGVSKTPVFTLTTDWLAQRVEGSGASSSSVMRLSNGITRDQKINRVTGTCIDPDQRYQALPFPAVQDAVLIAAEGEYATEVAYPGVNHIAHAQHLASIAIRENQASLRLEAMCNLHAYRCELFDVGTIIIPRYGMTAGLGKTAEVVGWRWHPTEGVTLQLSEIAPAIYTPEVELVGRDPAPNSDLPALTTVETLTISGIVSGTVGLSDSSVLTRTRVSWGAAVSAAVRVSGQIEVQYVEANAVPTDGSDWPSWIEAGTATEATIPGLLSGRWYVFRVRAIKTAQNVKGAWSAQAVHPIATPGSDNGIFNHQIYTRSVGIPATPTGPGLPAGWYDQWPNTTVGDADWALVLALLHFNGAAGSTTFTDQKGGGWTRSISAPYNDGELATDIVQHGNAALKMDGVSRINGPSGAAWVLSGDYSIEVSVYLETSASVFQIYLAGSDGRDIYPDVRNTSVSHRSGDGGTGSLMSATPATALAGRWARLYFGRQGSNLYIGIDGVVTAGTSGTTVTNSSASITLISTGGGTDGVRLDELRITKGLCRYTSNYTPVPAQFPDGDSIPWTDPVWTSNAYQYVADGAMVSPAWSLPERVTGLDGGEGTAGTDGVDAVAATLSASSIVLQADKNGVVASFTDAVTTMTVIKGAADDTSNWTIARSNSAGVTSSISGATVTITAMSVDTGYIDLTATRTGYATLTKRVTIAKVRSAGTPGMNPGFTIYADDVRVGPTGSSRATGKFYSDGTTLQDVQNGTDSAGGNWYAPTTAGIGSTYSVKFILSDGDTPTGAALNTWIALSTEPALSLTVSSTGTKNCELQCLIALTADTSNVLATGYMTLAAEFI